MDVIASTAFGLQVDSQTETDNQFVVHARNAFAALRITNPVILMMSTRRAAAALSPNHHSVSRV